MPDVNGVGNAVARSLVAGFSAVDIQTYLDKVTWEHRFKPKFDGTIRASVQPIAEVTELLRVLYQNFDLDTAVGVQLDAVGVRVGRDRFVDIPGSGEQALSDTQYRQVLRATIAANQWNGSIPEAHACYDILYIDNKNNVFIQDYGNMTMAVVLYGIIPVPPSFYTLQQTIALFMTNNLNLRPAGVKLYFLMRGDGAGLPLGETSGPGGVPAFGIGVSNTSIRGVGSEVIGSGEDPGGYLLKVVRAD